MKRFQEFTENVDRVAALKAKQRAAVDKFKSGNQPAPKQTPETSDRPDFAPPEIVRAMIAIQTGPGVINKIINAVI